MISITSKGNWKDTSDYLKSVQTSAGRNISSGLHQYGRLGVDALSKATPKESGLTSESWKYRIVKYRNGPGIEWYNTHEEDGFPVAILIQYGHATGTGGYVAGQDYINPAIKPVFDKIVADYWKKVR